MNSIVLAITAGSSVGSKRLARTALLSVVAAIGILSMTASAQPGGALFTPGASISFTGTGEINCGNLTPADQAIAVGDTTVGVFQAINVCLDVYTKNGVLSKKLYLVRRSVGEYPTTDPPRCSTGS